MIFNGRFHNKEYAGEGINVREYEDGYVQADVFTYNTDRSQLWLFCQGVRDGNTVVMDAWEPVGGVRGNPERLKNRTEKVWGTVTLTEEDGQVSVEYSGDDFVWGYKLQPIYETNEVPNTPTTPVVRITRERLGSTQNLQVPLDGPMATSPATYTLHVENAPITIVEAYASGNSREVENAYGPTLSGVSKGQTLQPGQYKIYCDIRGNWEQAGYETPRVYYVVKCKELGYLINLQLPVRDPQ